MKLFSGEKLHKKNLFKNASKSSGSDLALDLEEEVDILQEDILTNPKLSVNPCKLNFWKLIICKIEKAAVMLKPRYETNGD